MNTLHTFGCSYTAGYDTFFRIEYCNYRKFKGGTYPKIWAELLSEKLSLDLNNYGIGASSNYEIFQTFCDNVDQLKEKDVVIIGWSFKERFRLVNDQYNDFIRIGPGYSVKLPNISQNTIDEICVNRMNERWIDEIYSWEKLIKKLCETIGVKLLIWSFDGTFLEHRGMRNILEDMGAQTITEETNGEIEDLHFGELGHIIQSNYFHDILTGKIKYNNKKTRLI